MALLEPFRPTASQPWDQGCAAHLARRAGFGATPEELERLVALGCEGAVASFVDYPASEPELDARQAENGSALAVAAPSGASDGDLVARLRQQWIWRMVGTAHPLREKLALLWHDHFATAESKVVRENMLRQQYDTFQRLGGANFRELVGAIARDPAMLVYLDNRVSKKKHPNENWARELMELFTLGVNHYDQRDVAEIARVFTGWTTPERNGGPFQFDPNNHDTNDKLVLGQVIGGKGGARGEDEGDEVLDLLVARPECARFIAHKLALWFVAHEPAPDLAAELAGEFARQKSSIRETLRTLFSSQAFYAEGLRFRMHKSPVEWAVSAARMIGVRNVHTLGLEPRLARMGMRLFEPPSVAGWECGRAWTQSSQLAERYDLALELASVNHSRRAVFGAPVADFGRLHAAEADESATLVDRLSAHFLQRELQPAARAAVVEHLDTAMAVSPSAPSRDHELRERSRAVVHMLLCTPEFELA